MRSFFLLVLVSLSIAEKPDSLTLLPFPKFHQNYFQDHFWGKEDTLKHPYFAMRSGEISKDSVQSLLGIKDSVVPDHRLWIYANWLSEQPAEGLTEEFYSVLERIEGRRWKARGFHSLLQYTSEVYGDSLQLELWRSDKKYPELLGSIQRNDLEQRELSYLVNAKKNKELKTRLFHFLPGSRGAERRHLLSLHQEKYGSKGKGLSFAQWKVSVNAFRWSGQVKKAEKIALARPSKGLTGKKLQEYFSTMRGLYASAKNRKKEIEYLEKFIGTLQTKKSKVKHITALMRLLKKAKRFQERNEWKAKLKKIAPKSSRFAGELWVDGLELEQQGKYAQAKKKYLKLDRRFRGEKKGNWGVFRAGYVEFKQGNYREALKLFDKTLSLKLPLWPNNAAHLFRAECYRFLKEDSLAKASYYATIDDFPLGYYAHRARQKLGEIYRVKAKDIPKIQLIEGDRADMYRWLKEDKGAKIQPKDENLPIVEELLAVGAWTFVDLELKRKKKWTLMDRYDYSNLLLKYGYLAKSYRMVRRLINALPRQRMYRVPKSFAQLMFPVVYPEEVKTALDTSALHPYFVMGLMRQESIFDDQIQSPVGARGLMQIMPYTGEELAKQEELEGFEVDWLVNPLMAIRLGTRYLKDLYEEYDDVRYVLTNYNAGPKPTRRWIKENTGKGWEIEVEDVSYWETRDYVKKVLGNYWNYQLIWGDLD